MGITFSTRWSNKNIIIGLVAAIVAAAGWAFYSQSRPLASPFTTHILSTANTDLYYPGHLPGGYTIDYSSVQQPQTGITTLAINGPQGQRIFMSEQALPKSFDLQRFYKNFEHSSNSTVSVGQAVVGELHDGEQLQRVASIATNQAQKTWILINAGPATPVSTLQHIAAQLVKNK